MSIIALIIAAEVLMWVCIGLVIFARYKLKNNPLSISFFILMIVINIILLVLTAMDLKNGNIATFAHGLAAIYIGFSIAFGSSMILYADNLYKQYFLKEKIEKRKPTKKENAITTLRHFFAYVIGVILLYAMIQYVGNQESTGTLQWFIQIWTVVIAIDVGITLISLLNNKKKQ